MNHGGVLEEAGDIALESSRFGRSKVLAGGAALAISAVTVGGPLAEPADAASTNWQCGIGVLATGGGVVATLANPPAGVIAWIAYGSLAAGTVGTLDACKSDGLWVSVRGELLTKGWKGVLKVCYGPNQVYTDSKGTPVWHGFYKCELKALGTYG